MASRGASLCLCPRSNLWISGRLPNAEAAVRENIRLCIGTDSLASNADLDLFHEIAVLAQAFPGIDMTTWLRAATENGADVLGFSFLGRIAQGCSPGLLFLPGVDDLEALRQGAPRDRRWLVEPGRGDV